MIKWLIEDSRGGIIVVQATTLWEAAKIAAERYCDEAVLRAEAYYGGKIAINEKHDTAVGG